MPGPNTVMSIDEMQEILSDLVDELPAPFFRELTGGISLVREVKYNPQGVNNELYILGSYHRGGMGRLITLYYGSFTAVFGHLDRDAMVQELRRVLRHEFRHHLESLAGEKGLELEDEVFIQNYLAEKNRQGLEQ